MFNFILCEKQLKLQSQIYFNEKSLSLTDPFVAGMRKINFQPYQEIKPDNADAKESRIVLSFKKWEKRLINTVFNKRSFKNV